MSRAVTLRIDDADYAALEAQARKIGVRPGTLARILVHAGLQHEAASSAAAEARAALDRLVRRSRQSESGDAVALVAEARADLDPER